MTGETGLLILRRLIDSAPATLSAGAAEAVLRLQFLETDQARVDELATMSKRGTLSQAEAEEYDGYIAAADVLSLWKSKARLSMKSSAAV